MAIKVVDKSGQVRDWAWVQAMFGKVAVEPVSGDAFRVVQVTEIEGIMAFQCTLLNSAGGPVVGQGVVYAWPDGQQVEITNRNGMAEHSAGMGERYWPPGPGAISWKVQAAASERITGLGWLDGTNHLHLQVIMQWSGGDVPPPPPPPPPDWVEQVRAILNEAAGLLDQALGLLP